MSQTTIEHPAPAMSTTALRSQQNCPDWCDVTDHERVPHECATDAHHFRQVGEAFHFDVAILEFPKGGPYIELNGCDDKIEERFYAKMSAGEARSVAAMLVRAADEIEMNHAYERAQLAAAK